MALERGGRRRSEGEATGAGEGPERWLPVVLLAVAIALVGVWTVQRTTWYLAIDQFGYLTFARDLASGSARHDWELLPALKPLLPRTDVDVYAQTYVRRGDELFCRYAPGFPAMLAAARVAFGPVAEHLVNPVLLALLLVIVFALGRRLFGSAWLGLACALLSVLLPNYILLWSTSPLRDVPAHLVAWSGLLLLIPGGRRLAAGPRELLAGLLLGYAMTTRIDAVLYLAAAGGIALLDRKRFLRRLFAGTLGFAIGVTPLLAYNAVATGNPFRPTQAMEVNSVLSRAPLLPLEWLASVLPSPDSAVAAAGGVDDGGRVGVPRPSPTPFSVQGGGLRISNFRRTMPANARTVREALGDLLLVLAAVGAIAALRRPALFLLAVPYVAIAFLFFSLWTLPGPRYLTGVLLLLPLLAIEGARTLPELVARTATRAGRAAAIGVVVLLVGALAAVTLRGPIGEPSALPWIERVVVAAIGVACVASVTSDARRRELSFAIALGLGLATTLGWRSTMSLGKHASFQRPEVARARATVEAATDFPAVVLTTTRIGRPAENINYYTDVEAVYLEELVRWQAQPRFVVGALLKAGYAVYVLLTPDQAKQWLANPNIATWYTAETVRTIAPGDAVDYFVASPYHRGIPLVLVRLDPKNPGA